MWRSFSKRVSVAVAVVSAAALAVSADAAVAAVQGAGGDQRVTRTFVDSNGNAVRILSAGRGSQLTFTNLSSNATIALPASGAVMNTVVNADGLQTVTLTGNNVLIMFPSDVPAGPSTTLYVGRVVYTVDAGGVFTLVSTSGRATDLCAALS